MGGTGGTGGVRIITDSTADLGALAAENGVTVVPLTISFGDETYEDGVTISPVAFFARLAQSGQQPTTSQPSPGAMEAAYRAALDEGASGIVAIHISSRLSGTYAAGERVAQELRAGGAVIEVIDSRQASLSMQFGVLAAARVAQAGGSVAAAAAAARDALERSDVFLVADDLQYLQKGGRIGQAQRVVGSLLQVKPIITVRDGLVVSRENPRTRKRAYERLAEYVRELAPVEEVIVGQADAALGDQLEGLVRQVYAGPVRRAWAGPTIGSHVGPSAVGVATLRAHR